MEFEEAKYMAQLCASETGYEWVILDNNSYWPDHWIEKNPSVSDRIIYSTLD